MWLNLFSCYWHERREPAFPKHFRRLALPTTRFVANRTLRAERRRQTREETAASMIPSTTFCDENEAVWKELERYLDQAVASLSETDHQAILLRFYQKKPFLEVGRRLGLSEEGAKKRVSRAIQKMRDFLAGMAWR